MSRRAACCPRLSSHVPSCPRSGGGRREATRAWRGSGSWHRSGIPPQRPPPMGDGLWDPRSFHRGPPIGGRCRERGWRARRGCCFRWASPHRLRSFAWDGASDLLRRVRHPNGALTSGCVRTPRRSQAIGRIVFLRWVLTGVEPPHEEEGAPHRMAYRSTRQKTDRPP
jgi:hypothetical protein